MTTAHEVQRLLAELRALAELQRMTPGWDLRQLAAPVERKLARAISN